MKKIKSILDQIDQLSQQELQLLLDKVMERVKRREKIDSAFKNFVGSGTGVWDMDAQEYINQIREED